MKFDDIYVFQDERFSVGIEKESGKYYISFPVFNGLAEYEEYYEIDRNEFEKLPENLIEIRAILKLSREHKNDDRLIMKPGSVRGFPVV